MTNDEQCAFFRDTISDGRYGSGVLGSVKGWRTAGLAGPCRCFTVFLSMFLSFVCVPMTSILSSEKKKRLVRGEQRGSMRTMLYLPDRTTTTP